MRKPVIKRIAGCARGGLFVMQIISRSCLSTKNPQKIQDQTQRLAKSFESAVKELTPETAVKFLSKLSMYDEKGQLKR